MKASSGEVSDKTRVTTEMLAFARQELAHALRSEAERYERRTDIRHLSIRGYQAVTKLHDRDTLEADSFALSPGRVDT